MPDDSPDPMKPFARPPRRRGVWRWPSVRHDIWTVRLDPATAVVPEGCACCGATAAASSREEGPRGATLIVPYCSDCSWHVSAATTRALAAALSSALAALTLAAVLPLVWPTSNVWLYALSVGVGAVAPIVVSSLWRTVAAEGHSARGRAAWWKDGSTLACTNARWAELLSSANGVAPPTPLRVVARPPRWALAGLVIATFITPWFYRLHHPTVRVLNLTVSRLSITMDGTPVAAVEPTSAESPSAGIEVRLPVGRHTLVAIAAGGEVVDRRDVRIRSGVSHLYAPASPEVCFWLERTRYGREQRVASARQVEPLDAGTRFWAVDRHIDTWFSPNPASAGDLRSTGGRLTALRQAPCAEAPLPIRRWHTQDAAEFATRTE